MAVTAVAAALASVYGCSLSVAVTTADGGTGADGSASGSGSGGGSGGSSGASGSGSGGASSGSGSSGGGSSSGASSGGDAGATNGDFPDGQGMDMPWVELQAEDTTHATTGGPTVKTLPPSRTKWDKTQIQAEAIGRQAVELSTTGDYVEFTVTAPANSIVVRYSIPDSATGGGLSATLGLYVNGTRVKSMNLTSHYSWSYNGEYIPGAPDDEAGVASLESPASPYPHTFFDEYNSGPGDGPENQPVMPTLSAGDKVRLQRDSQDTASNGTDDFYIIDLVDFEDVPAALTMPAGFTSIVTASGGAIQPNDGKDHADDLETVLLGGAQKLWFPPGEYIVRQFVKYACGAGASDCHVALDNQGSEIAGAGMWYTRILGKQAIFFCDVMAPCNVHDLAIWGDSTARDEPQAGAQKAFAGPQGKGTQLYDLWIEHEVAGIWVGNDPDSQMNGPTQGLQIHDVRIRDTYADGINLDNGTSGSTVDNCHMRNTGDDAATVWAVDWPDCVEIGQCAAKADETSDPGQGVGNGNTFNHISVQMPWRANCFAAYGGYGNTWENSTCEDVLTYPGIFVDQEFGSYPFGSQNTPAPPAAQTLTTFDNISVVRAGGEMFYEPGGTSCPGSNDYQGASCAGLTPWYHGAIKLYMRWGNVNDVLISNVTVVDPTYAGIELRGFSSAVAQTYGMTGIPTSPVNFLQQADDAQYSNVTLQNITVTGAQTYGLLAQDLETGMRGTVSFEGVVISGSAMGASNLNGAPASLINKVGNSNQGF
ncbi:MAG: hypothetical protein ABSE49_02885 [Polyangiaceae bacterium]